MPYRICAENQPEDLEIIRGLLGREPLSAFTVVVRDETGQPVVIQNAPFLDDGTPMPTRFWLVGAAEINRVGRLEADGGVKAAEAAIAPELLRAAHDRYQKVRDLAIPEDHEGPRPFGGVGGTREGVKCLHAHYAWFLAGGDDPVGEWVQEQFDSRDGELVIRLEVGEATISSQRGWQHRLESTPTHLHLCGLNETDPPHPASLTNALGSVEDDLIEMLRTHPELPDALSLKLTGSLARSLAQVEIGLTDIDAEVEITREALEEVFRVLATESVEDRAANPGLPPQHVELIVAASCIAVGTLRTLGLSRVVVAQAEVVQG
jgi:hypothetical protein